MRVWVLIMVAIAWSPAGRAQPSPAAADPAQDPRVAAAGFTSTVLDLGRFASWQFRLLATGHTELLDVDSLREMHRLQWMEPDWKTSRGLAFGMWRSGDKSFVGHSGYCPGYQSTLLLQTAEQVATVS